MAFTDYSYYKGSLKIASPIIQGDDTTDFDLLLAEYEEKYLVELLGYDLYKAFTDGLLVGSPLQKWLDLRDGKVYTTEDSEGRTVNMKWNGLINSEKRSLLAYFVWFEYMRNNYTQQTTAGEVKPNFANSERAGISDLNNKLIDNFNKGIDLYGFDIENMTGKNFLLKSKDYQSHFLSNMRQFKLDYYKELLKPTAYNFIYAMNKIDATTYPNWNFTEKNKLNYLGI